MPIPDEAKSLIEKFGAHMEAYKSGGYGETEVRREFIDPLFKTLGWDVDNNAGHAEAYRDVVHEDAVRVGGSMKAPEQLPFTPISQAEVRPLCRKDYQSPGR